MNSKSADGVILEGEDYYFEGAFVVFTEAFLLRRGYCCESGCRHCPYGFKKKEARGDAPTTHEREED